MKIKKIKRKKMNKIIEFLLFRGIDKKKLFFLVKFLVLSIYADKNINELEIAMAKNVLQDYFEKYYSGISKKRKEKILSYLSEMLLKELRKVKTEPDYFKELEAECLADFQEEEDKIFFIEKMFDIFWADNTILEEEKELFNKFNRFVENVNKGEKYEERI
jgi:uncharacterized tellurite resistance protein B-like protein